MPLSFIDLLDDPDEFQVIVALSLAAPLNLKKLSRVCGMPESSLYRKIQGLLDKNYIQLDGEATALHRGKYYRLSPTLVEVFDHATEDAAELQLDATQNLSVGDLIRLIETGEVLSTINTTMVKTFIGFQKDKLLRAASVEAALKEDLFAQDSEKGKIYSAFSLMGLNFQTPAERKEFEGYLNEFFANVQKFECTAGSPKKADHQLFLSIFPITHLFED